MKHLLLATLLCVMAVAPGRAQTASPGRELEATLTFETTHAGSMPAGWGGGPPSTIFVDGETVHSGRWAARIERAPGAGGQPFAAMTRSIPIEFAGTTIEWRGFLRSDNVDGYMALFVSLDGDMTPVFVSLEPRQIKGTNDWAEYSMTLPLDRRATTLSFGVVLGGSGKVWADDLRLLVDGKPVWEAPRPKTPLDTDHQFDSGSSVVISQLSNGQIEHLAVLGKVWGFLKYHHPAITGGTRHWDYDLFRVMPGVLSARDRQSADQVIFEWARQLGTPPVCDGCTAPRSDDTHLLPDLGWLDRDVSPPLAEWLRNVHRGRSQGRQFYVSQVRNIRNPQFDRDLAYPTLAFPDAGYQLLGLYRFWNIIQYWFPYRDQIDGDWHTVLAEFIPRIAAAKDKDAYQLEMLALIARVTDTHANLWSASPQLRPPAGSCQLPVTARFIEGQAVVTGYSNTAPGPMSALQIGDIIDVLDGTRVADLVRRLEPYYPASNQPRRLWDIARSLTRGSCGEARVGIRRAGGAGEIVEQRQPIATLDQQAGTRHDMRGDTFRVLPEQVAYLKLSSVKVADVGSYVERAKGTRGLIIDIRNYPSEFVVLALGSLLVQRPTPFTRFTAGDLDNPGAFRWIELLSLTPQQPHYPGKVVVLVDESSLSQAEYTALALRAAPQTTVVGSTTAGADGNVSQIALPGGLRTAISGIGVFYPDKRPTQRIGIVPDVEVRPTIAGIRAGRDEVLEEAIRQIVGR